MLTRLTLGVFFASASLLLAQDEAADAPSMTPKEEVMEQLFSERESAEALEQAIQSARKLGIPEQAILESKFLFHIASFVLYLQFSFIITQ